MYRVWIFLGALAGLLAVAMEAASAHVLIPRIGPAALALVQGGSRMLGWHALALILCGIWAERRRGWLVNGAALAFAFGMLGFTGSLYLLGLTGIRLPNVAPIGGGLLMLGWLLLALSALRR